jgi:hypothetical protein
MEFESVPLGNDPDRREFNEVASLFDAPAYIRRGRSVEEALDHLLAKARKQREEWLAMPRLYIGQLYALAGTWSSLRPLVADAAQLTKLEELHTMLSPKLRVPIAPTTSSRQLRNALAELVSSIERFNHRWHAYLKKIDVSPVNEARAGYNRYYVIEKACALRSDVLARLGFTPLPALDLAELQRHLPTLPMPRCK